MICLSSRAADCSNNRSSADNLICTFTSPASTAAVYAARWSEIRSKSPQSAPPTTARSAALHSNSRCTRTDADSNSLSSSCRVLRANAEVAMYLSSKNVAFMRARIRISSAYRRSGDPGVGLPHPLFWSAEVRCPGRGHVRLRNLSSRAVFVALRGFCGPRLLIVTFRRSAVIGVLGRLLGNSVDMTRGRPLPQLPTIPQLTEYNRKQWPRVVQPQGPAETKHQRSTPKALPGPPNDVPAAGRTTPVRLTACHQLAAAWSPSPPPRRASAPPEAVSPPS